MTEAHKKMRIKANSRYIGAKCPVTQVTLQAGDNVVICQQSNVAYSADNWQEIVIGLNDHCPYCNNNLNSISKLSISDQTDYLPTDSRHSRITIWPVLISSIGFFVCGLILTMVLIGGGIVGQQTPLDSTLESHVVATIVPTDAITPTSTPKRVISSTSIPTRRATATPTSKRQRPASTPTRRPRATVTPNHRQLIVNVLEKYGDIKVENTTYLDSSRLSEVLIEPVLERQRRSACWLRNEGLYYEHGSRKLEVTSLTINQDRFATVLTQITESRTLRHTNGTIKTPKKTETYQAIYELKRLGSNNWYIFCFQALEEGDPKTCEVKLEAPNPCK